MIKASKLTKIYQTGEVEVRALDGVSFQIDKGEFVAIMGPSGSGKSTLMHILGALDMVTSGDYFLDGEKIAELSDDQLAEVRNKKIGFVFQSYNLLARTTALRNVMVPMMYGDINKEIREKRARRYLEMVGLKDRMGHTPGQLSGGQQQRVAIARALSMRPSIILADEPTGNIASKQAEEIMEVFEDLNDKGNTIIMITHEREVAEYAKRIVYLRDGKITKDRSNGKRRLVVRKKHGL
jgi:putative ABC transport system ATP-binding protein